MRNLDVQRTVLRSLGLDTFLTPGTVAALLAGALRVGEGLTTVGRWLRLGLAMLWAPLGHWAESLEHVYGALPGLSAIMRLQQSLAGIQAPLQKAQPAVEAAVKAAVEATAPLATQVASTIKTASAASVQTATQVASSAASGVQSATAGVKSAVSKALPAVSKAIPLRRSTISDEEAAARAEKALNAAAADIAAARLAKQAEDTLWQSAVADAGRKKDASSASAQPPVSAVEVRPPPAPAGSYVPRVGPGAPKSVTDDDDDMQLRIVFTAQLWPRDAETPEEAHRIGEVPAAGDTHGAGSGHTNDEIEVVDTMVGAPIDPYDGYAGEEDDSSGGRALAEAARQFTIEESGPTLAVVAKRVRSGSGFGSSSTDGNSTEGDTQDDAASAASKQSASASSSQPSTSSSPLSPPGLASTDPLQYYVPGTLLFMGYPQGYTRQVLKLQRAREREQEREKSGRKRKSKASDAGKDGQSASATASASTGLSGYGSPGGADDDDDGDAVSPALTTLFEPMADDASLLTRARYKRSRGLQLLASRLAAASSYGHYLQEARGPSRSDSSDDDDDDEEDEGYFRRRILRPVTSAADSWWRIARDDLGYTHGLQHERDHHDATGDVAQSRTDGRASEDPAAPPPELAPSAEPGKQLYHPPVLDDYRGPVLMRLRHPWEGLVTPSEGSLLHPPVNRAPGSLPLAGAPMLNRFVAASARGGDDADSDSDDEDEAASNASAQRMRMTAASATPEASPHSIGTLAAAVASSPDVGRHAHIPVDGQSHHHNQPRPLHHHDGLHHAHHDRRDQHDQHGSNDRYRRSSATHLQGSAPEKLQHLQSQQPKPKPRSSLEAIGMAAASAAAATLVGGAPQATPLPPPPALPATVLPRDDSRYFSTFVLSSFMVRLHDRAATASWCSHVLRASGCPGDYNPSIHSCASPFSCVALSTAADGSSLDVAIPGAGPVCPQAGSGRSTQGPEAGPDPARALPPATAAVRGAAALHCSAASRSGLWGRSGARFATRACRSSAGAKCTRPAYSPARS